MKSRLVCCTLVVFLIVSQAACLPGKNVFYGLSTIKMPDGKEVYVKRMVWGLTSSSSITVISPNKDLYDFREAKTDYVFSWDVGIFYRIERDTLILYVNGSKAKPPESGQFPIEVEQVDMNIKDYIEMTKNPEKFGIKVLEITIDDKL